MSGSASRERRYHYPIPLWLNPLQELAGISGASALIGDLAGQLIPRSGRPCEFVNLSEAIGAGLGSSWWIYGAVTAQMAVALGASELGQALAPQD